MEKGRGVKEVFEMVIYAILALSNSLSLVLSSYLSINITLSMKFSEISRSIILSLHQTLVQSSLSFANAEAAAE